MNIALLFKKHNHRQPASRPLFLLHIKTHDGTGRYRPRYDAVVSRH